MTTAVAVVTILILAQHNYLCDAKKYFGFYDVQPAEVSDFNHSTNIFQASTISDARSVYENFGQQSLLLVYDIFFSGGHMKENWKLNWQNLSFHLRQNKFVGINSSFPILGFNLGDELVWNCYDIDDVNTAAHAVRQTFAVGEAIVWYNEAAIIQHKPVKDSCGNNKSFYIPKALDWFSVDIYHMNGVVEGWVDTFVKSYYEKFIIPNFTESYQKALLVPGSFGSNVNHYPNGTYICDQVCYDLMCAHDAADFATWAKSDSNIIAAMPWNWGGCPACNGSRFTPPHTCCMDEIGTKNMNITKRAWIAAGKSIIAEMPQQTNTTEMVTVQSGSTMTKLMQRGFHSIAVTGHNRQAEVVFLT